jgi:hypothetical protein
MPFLDTLPDGAECILQLTERPAGLNFGRLRAAIFWHGGSLNVSLA